VFKSTVLLSFNLA